jgi:predicted nucleic acid-binding protein
VKVLSREPLSSEARALLALPRRFLAPDLLPIELGNVPWRKVQRGLLTPDEALGAQVGSHALAPVRILPSATYQSRALVLALAYERSFYACLYLAVAEAEGAVFVTADERFPAAGGAIYQCEFWD